ncbi:hypothetical protein R6Q59_023466 [Mikania micrantha]|uniref:Shikimate O-hydroxycinnamoyltransferase n=1 Tax=Mikania micrantha TaxID=192012 RepID=A0A5N6N113_9ASTR|nr:hypothetical protein E3N88_28637 [Mikania micrantha]
MQFNYHLLKFGISKGHKISNQKCFHQLSSIRSQNLLNEPHRPQPQPQPTVFSRVTNENLRYIHVGTPVGVITQYGRIHHQARLSTLGELKLPDHEESNPLDYQVTVKGRDVIRAAHEPKIEYWLPQSNLDLLLPALDAGVFFCYDAKEDGSMSPETIVKNMKKSLAGVLSTFYPLAGEIASNGQGEPEVLCNNNGVEFVHAHADVELKMLDLHHPDETIKGKLVPKITRGVLSVQVTELNCGAIILSCAFDHRIADGASLNMFLVAWAEFTRLKNISIIPRFRPSILNPRHPPYYNTIYDNLYLPISSLPPPPPFEDQLHSRIYYIRAESIRKLQSEAISKENSQKSKFVSFTAFVWKLIAQDNGNHEPNTASRMGVVVSGRQFLSGNNEKETSMFANHFGNILSVPYGVMNNHHLQNMQLHEVANKVHEFVSEVKTQEHFKGLIDWVELHRPEPAVAKVYFKLQESDGEAVVVSSGQGLPINDANFGWGEPNFGSYHFPWGGQTGYITTMPSAKKNGDWIVYAHLKQKHLDLIETKARHVFNPITTSYLLFN